MQKQAGQQTPTAPHHKTPVYSDQAAKTRPSIVTSQDPSETM